MSKDVKNDIKGVGKKGAGFLKEFGEFISQGNVIDMAVGVIIGAAFKSVIDSLVNNVIMPFVTGLIGSIDLSDVFVTFRNSKILYGDFISQVINFILLGFVIFLFVKIVSGVRKKIEARKKAAAEEAPATTKVCPYCMSEIDIKATRCPHCTSVLSDSEE
jgi:large conductance mechanosensitive channel